MSGSTCPACGRVLEASAARCAACGFLLALDGETVTIRPEVAAPPDDHGTVTHAPPPSTEADEQPPISDAGTLTHSPERAAASPGRRWPTIPGYEIEAELGRGGMGVVYKARQLSPRRTVALKMILGVGHAARFRAEVAAVARLNHPNIVHIHEVGELGGRAYFSMEYVPGGTLAQRLRRQPVPAVEAARLVAALARAVQHAHDRGIVHRDLKPGNVLLAEGEAGDGLDRCAPKIADFGLAKHLDGSGDGAPTQSGAVLGTPSYMAPEQARGKVKEIGPAVDVYALGAILYECLTGRPPFREDGQLETLMKVISEDPTPPRELRPELPRDVEVVCLKCLRKEPGKRYATAGELADDLERFAAGKPVAARARTVRERVVGWAGRRREYLFLAAGTVLASGLALALLSWWPRNKSTTDPLGPDASLVSLPPDLQLVPPNSFAFVTIRVADLMANPAARDVLDHARPIGGDIASEIERFTSVNPADVERVTFVFSRYSTSNAPLIILATARPYSLDRFHTTFTEKGYLVQQLGERRVYVPGDQRDVGFLPLSDRVLVFGAAEMVGAVASGRAAARGPLTPALELAGRNHTLVLAANPSAEAVGNAFVSLRLGPGADPAARLRTLGLTADVSPAPGPAGQVAVEVNAWADYPDAASTALALPHTVAVPQTLLKFTELFRDPTPISFLARPYLARVGTAPWHQDGATLRGSTRVEVEPAAVKAQLTDAFSGRRRRDSLRSLAGAMQQYHDKHGRFPPAVVTDAAGKPLYSWRVLLLPHLGEENVYRRFHLNRAWDHPSNRPLLDQMPKVFASPFEGKGGNITQYQVLTGPGGLFDAPEGRSLTEVTDGADMTILLVEALTAVPWTQPADVVVDDRQPKLDGAGGLWFLTATASGTVRPFPRESVTPELLRGMFTRAGGEKVTLP